MWGDLKLSVLELSCLRPMTNPSSLPGLPCLQYVDWSPSAAARTGDRLPDVAGDPSPDRIHGAHREGQTTRIQPDAVSDANSTQQFDRSRHALFFTDPGSLALYRAHAHAMTHRQNTYNG